MMKHPQDRTAEILKKSAEDKVLIYEAQITDDKIKQVTKMRGDQFRR